MAMAHDLLDSPTTEFETDHDAAVTAVEAAVAAGGGTSRVDLVQDDDSAVVVLCCEAEGPTASSVAFGPADFDGSPSYEVPIEVVA